VSNSALKSIEQKSKVAAHYAEYTRNPPNVLFMVTQYAEQAVDLYLEIADLQSSVDQKEEAVVSFELGVDLAEVGFGMFSSKLTKSLKQLAKHSREHQLFDVESKALKRLVHIFKLLHGTASQEYKQALAKLTENKGRLRKPSSDGSEDQDWLLKLG
jgi:hypothetical protein